jgi:hypothetical protein
MARGACNLFFGDFVVKSLLFVATALIATTGGHQAYAEYNFVSVADPSATFGTAAIGINNAGVIVGDYVDGSGQHGFTDVANSFNNFDAPGATATVASGISASNEVVGYYTDASGATHGFTSAGSVFSTFDAPFAGAAGTTFGAGISQAGSATAGYFFDAGGTSHGFLKSAGYTQIDAPSASVTVVTGVNNASTSVGYYVDAAGTTHSFVRSAAGAYSSIDDPSGALGTFVTGINDLGEITGYYIDASNVTHGFVLSGTDFVTIDAPDALSTEINGINDFGEIVGQDIDALTGQLDGFAATVPEPATLSVLGFGALMLLKARRRRTL